MTMFSGAKAYQEFMGRWSTLLTPLLLNLAEVPDSGRVLDIGSGTGALAFPIARSTPQSLVVGIDPSREYLAHAKTNNSFPERVSFAVADAQQLNFQSGTFQSSLSLLALTFVPDPEKSLREARRVTTPGAHISAAVWDYGAGMRMLRVFWDAAASIDANAEGKDEKHMPLCRAGELAQLWKEGALRNIRDEALDITMPFESFSDYWDPFLLGQGPAGAYLRGLLCADDVNALRTEVLRRLPVVGENVPFSLPARAWSVRGTVPAGPRRLAQRERPAVTCARAR